MQARCRLKKAAVGNNGKECFNLVDIHFFNIEEFDINVK
jgi:hypothetical protein